jgi:hypothetical protein
MIDFLKWQYYSITAIYSVDKQIGVKKRDPCTS